MVAAAPVSSSIGSRLRAARAARSSCSRATAVVLAGVLTFVESVKKLPLIRNELLQLVLVKVVGRVEPVESALALTALDHVRATYEDYWNELEWCVYGVDLVFRDLIFELRKTPVVAKRL